MKRISFSQEEVSAIYQGMKHLQLSLTNSEARVENNMSKLLHDLEIMADKINSSNSEQRELFTSLKVSIYGSQK